jgi:hypothetical protein
MPRFLLRLIALLIFVSPAYAEPDSLINTTPAKLRLSFEQLTLPGNEQMGLFGGTFLYDVNEWLSLGPGSYGALTGQRGGFITLGLASELRKELWKDVEINAGLFAGAGGGSTALQGGGLMLRSHLGADFKSEWGNVGGGISYVDFPNSNSNSVQPYVAYEYPFSTLIAGGWPDRQQTGPGAALDIASSESEFALVARSYRVPAGVLADNGLPQHPTINLLGVEWQRYLSDSTFLKIEAEGSMGGQSNGYMQILLGGGYRFRVTESTALKASASLGVAGGGNVATGGGLLLDASLALQQHITDNLFVEFGGGYVDAPDGDFRAMSLNAKLGYSYSMPDVQGEAVSLGALADYNQHNMRMRLVHQTYLKNDPQWRNHHADLDVDLLGFQGDYFLTEMFYLSGQGIAAYNGQAGGYMTGLVGGGVHLPVLQSPLFVDLELLGGAAGGGGLDVGGGMVWQGNVGLGYRFSGPYSLIASYGQIQAPGGNFKAHALGVSLAYHFAFFAR